MLRPRKRFENPVQQYWRIVVKRRVSLALFLIGSLAIACLYTFSLTERYASHTVLLIEDSAKTLNIAEAAQLSPSWYTTQFQIMTSTPVLRRVVEALDLTERYRSNPGRLRTLLANLRGEDLAKVRPAPEAVIPLLQRSISVSPRVGSGLFDVRVVGTDPNLVHDIAETLVDIFIEESVSSRIQLSIQATEYLTKRLEKISNRIQQKERELEDFETNEGIGAAAVLLEYDTKQLTEFSNGYIAAQTERWELEERLKVLESVVQEEDFSGIAGPGIDGSELGTHSKELFDARLNLDKLRQRGLLDKHPDIIAARDVIETLQKRLVFESRAHIAGIRAQIAGLKQREKSLEEMMQKLRPGASLERRKKSRYEFLKREITTQKGFYEAYNEQLRRLQLLDDVRSITVRVVEDASRPSAPFSPNHRTNIAFGLLSGALLGLTVVFLRDYLDDTMKSADDVQDYLEMPVVGTIPVIGEGARLLPWKLDTQSLVLEAYRSLRTNLQFFETDQPLRTLLICSAGPGEGKSTTAANIALTLAQMGRRVCVVDTDMRRPVLHKLFKVDNNVGLSTVFTDAPNSDPPIVKTRYGRLSILPCGPAPPNAAELLSSRRMESFIEKLTKDFDHVIFDSPPLLMVTDAQILSSLMDGVLVVLKSNDTRIGAAQKCLDILASGRAKTIGVILNRVQLRHSTYYPYYSRYYDRYGGYYGKSRKKKSKSKSDRISSAESAESPAEDIVAVTDHES